MLAGILPTIQGYDSSGRPVWKADESARVDTTSSGVRYNKGQPDFNTPTASGFEGSEYASVRVTLKSISVAKEYGKGSMSGSDVTFTARLGSSFAVSVYPSDPNTQHNMPTKVWCTYTVHNGQPTLYIDTESSNPIAIPISSTAFAASDIRSIRAGGNNAKLLSASAEVWGSKR